MQFFQDLWRGVKAPQKPNQFARQYAANLMQGGGAKGPIANMGNKIIGGWMAGRQNAGQAAQEAKTKGILSKLFSPAQASILTAQGEIPVGAGGTGVLAPLSPTEFEGGMKETILEEGDLIPELQKPGALAHLPKNQQTLAKFGIDLYTSGSDEGKVLGAMFMKNAFGEGSKRIHNVGGGSVFIENENGDGGQFLSMPKEGQRPKASDWKIGMNPKTNQEEYYDVAGSKWTGITPEQVTPKPSAMKLGTNPDTGKTEYFYQLGGDTVWPGIGKPADPKASQPGQPKIGMNPATNQEEYFYMIGGRPVWPGIPAPQRFRDQSRYMNVTGQALDTESGAFLNKPGGGGIDLSTYTGE